MTDVNWEHVAAGWANVAASRQALIEQLKAEKGKLASEVDRLRNREIPLTVTRVDIVGNEVREYWADQWTPYVGDNGRTLKLFALGKGAVAKAERDTALGKELAAVLERRYCNRCGGAYVGHHVCLRPL